MFFIIVVVGLVPVLDETGAFVFNKTPRGASRLQFGSSKLKGGAHRSIRAPDVFDLHAGACPSQQAQSQAKPRTRSCSSSCSTFLQFAQRVLIGRVAIARPLRNHAGQSGSPQATAPPSLFIERIANENRSRHTFKEKVC